MPYLLSHYFVELNKIKMKFDLVQSGSILKLTSTISGGLFAGGALYITLVEQPARMTHDPISGITQWKPSFVRASSLQVCFFQTCFFYYGIYFLYKNFFVYTK